MQVPIPFNRIERLLKKIARTEDPYLNKQLDNLMDIVWLKGVSTREYTTLYRARFKTDACEKILEKIIQGSFTATQCKAILNEHKDILDYIQRLPNDYKSYEMLTLCLQRCDDRTKPPAYCFFAPCFQNAIHHIKLKKAQIENALPLLVYNANGTILQDVANSEIIFVAETAVCYPEPSAPVMHPSRIDIPDHLRMYIEQTIKEFETPSYFLQWSFINSIYVIFCSILYQSTHGQEARYLHGLLNQIDQNPNQSYTRCIENLHPLEDDVYDLSGLKKQSGATYRIVRSLQLLDNMAPNERMGDSYTI